MKEMARRTAIAALVGVVSASMLAGCGGEKEVDGTATVATVDGTEIQMGVLSLYVRESQAQTEAMYASLMGSYGYSIWDNETDDGQTYGEQAVSQCLQDLELMTIMKEKAADYGVELTEDDETAISEAAAAFIEANTEDALKDLAVTEDQVKTYLELQTYKSRIYDPIVADVDTEVSDDEAQKSSFTYLSISTSDLTDEEIEEKQADAQSILDTLLADSTADFDETCAAVNEDYSTTSGSFTTNEDADTDEEEESDYTSGYPNEVVDVLRTLEDGAYAPEVITTDTAIYVVRLDQMFDEDATESNKESIISERKTTMYDETTNSWLEEADIEEDSDVIATLTVTDSHTYSITTASDEEDSSEVTTDETIDDAEVIDQTADETTEETTDETADDTAETTTDDTEAAEESEETTEETTEE